MSIQSGSTLRLNMPQWQGGNQPEYHFGAQLLAWLAPAAEGPVGTVPVPEPAPGEKLSLENGIIGRCAIARQAREARQAIEKHRPARIATLGGDCLVDLGSQGVLRYPGNGLNSRGMSYADRITIEPGKCGGRPCIRGYRMRVKDVLELLAHGASWDEILADYSFLEREDIQACLDFAAAQSDHALIKVS